MLYMAKPKIVKKLGDVFWIYRCPLCHNREHDWVAQGLYMKLPEMPEDKSFTPVGIGEIAWVGRNFNTVGYTIDVPDVMLDRVISYLENNHKVMVKTVAHAIGISDDLSEQIKGMESDIVRFHNPATGGTAIVTQAQAVQLHKLWDSNAKEIAKVRKRKNKVKLKLEKIANQVPGFNQIRKVHNYLNYCVDVEPVGDTGVLRGANGTVVDSFKLDKIVDKVFDLDSKWKDRLNYSGIATAPKIKKPI